MFPGDFQLGDITIVPFGLIICDFITQKNNFWQYFARNVLTMTESTVEKWKNNSKFNFEEEIGEDNCQLPPLNKTSLDMQAMDADGSASKSLIVSLLVNSH